MKPVSVMEFGSIEKPIDLTLWTIPASVWTIWFIPS